VVTPASGTLPTPAQVKAGNNAGGTAAFKSGSMTNASLTDATVTISGLAAATTYNIYTVSEDATPNLQTAVSTLSVTTNALVDVIPPVNVAQYPKTDAITMTSFNLLSNLNEAGKTYYVLIPSGGVAPTTTAQVRAGLDGSNNAAFKAGSIDVSANTEAVLAVAGLSAGANYALYVVSEDKAATPNLQTAFSTLQVNTLSPPLPSAVIISQYYEGTSTNKWIELTNLSNQPVNTASPQLKLALYNISGDAGTINITGAPSQVVSLNITIPAHGTVLIGNSGNGTEVPYITPASAAQVSNAVINFNGNDGVALLDANNNIIDAFGQGVNAKDISYVRNLSVTAGTATFNVNDWEVVSIQTVQNAIDDDDQNRLGVHFAPNLSPCTAPTVAATNLSFSAITTNSISGSFTASTDANEYLVVRSLNPTLSSLPVDGTVYNVGSSLGGGVISNRLVTSTFSDNNLASSTQYYYFIFPLNNTSCTGGPVYLTSNVLTATVTTKTLAVCDTPTNQATGFTITSSNYNFIQGAYTLAAGPADEYLVVMSKNANFAGIPSDRTVYNVGDAIADGIVIKRGAGNTFLRSGLAQNTTYYFFVYAVNSACSGGPLYLTANPLKGSQKTGILDANNLNFYYGNLHSHSSFSDGNKDNTSNKPAEDYAFAKNSMKMDFLGISEHNHTQAGMSLANWQPGIDAAKAATNSTFVALHGMEWGVISGGGHVIVYGIDSLIGWEPGENQIFVPKSTYTGPTGLFRIINRHGLNAIATLAHPNTTDFGNIAANYDLSADSAIVGSALESGPAFSTNITYSDPASSMSYLSYYNRMLARGYHLGATIDHDNHNLTFGRHTRARLVVLAPALTENDLLDAMKKMRFYASEDSAARVTFTINKLPVGSVFTGTGAPEISFNMATTNPVTSIKLMFGIPGSGIAPTEIANSANGTLTFTHSALADLSTGYYYGDIVESDGSRIITSPIWYTRDARYVKAVQHITFPATRSLTYGDPDSDTGASSDNPSKRITYTSSDPTVATIVDDKIHVLHAGTVTITASQESDALYQAASAQQVLTVAAKPITVTAVANKKLTSAADPVFTYTSTGTLVRTDQFSGALSRVAGETPGTYAITQGTLAITADYAITYQPASFTILARPAATISGDVIVAQNATPPSVVFTATSGTAPFTFTYHINTGADQIVTTSTNTTSLTVPTTAVGTYTYRLTQIADANSTAAQQLQSTVTVKPLPLAAIAGSSPVCVNGPSQTITFTGSNGTAPYTFSYTVNGGSVQTIRTTTGNAAIVNAPANTAGTFNYDLVSVSDAYGSQPQSGRATLQVNALATASISGSATTVVGAQQPAVTFTASNGRAPYVFTYTVNGGANQTILASTGNTATLTVPTSTPNTYTYNLVQVADANCSQAQSGSVTVQIRPLPVATIAGTNAVCVTGSSPVVTFTGSNGTAPYIFTYTINGTRNTINSASGTATIAVPTNNAGVYTYVLENVSDVYGSQAQSGAATVTVNALPVIQIGSSKGLTLSKGESLILTAAGGVGNTTYSWTGSDIVSGQNSMSATVRPRSSGVYTVRVTNASGCSTTEQINITVEEDYKLEASTIVTPNGDGKNDKFIIKNLDYYPNNTLKIFDKSGRVIYTMKSYANDWDGTLNGSPLAEGTYYYILDLGSNKGNFKGFINILRD
ncbi:MAG: T9SS type B sorting domain-containing protein, partial [Pedobacter sp.]